MQLLKNDLKFNYFFNAQQNIVCIDSGKINASRHSHYMRSRAQNHPNLYSGLSQRLNYIAS